MLTTQYNGTNGLGGLGALVSSASTAELQRYLASIGKLAQANVTGQMNPQTFAVVYDLLVQSAATVAKIPLLPANIRSGIGTVTGALQSADKKIKDLTYGLVSLPKVIANFTNLNAILGMVSSSAASAVRSAYEAIANTVAGASSTILAAVKIFFPPTSGGGVQPSTALIEQMIQPIKDVFTTQGTATTTPAPTQTYPAGTIYAFSKKRAQYRIAIPRVYGGGLGIATDGMFSDCVFGDCGLGASATMTEVAPSSTAPAGGLPVSETELEKRTGTLPIYKNWMFWAAVGGGVAVVGTGTALLMRRKKVA